MKVYPYIRVSTDEQAKSGLGLDDQLAATREFSVRRLGVEPEEATIDGGTSGAVEADKRDKLDKLIAKLRRGDVLLVLKRDRASRGDPEAMAKIERPIKTKRAWFLSVANEGTWTGSVFEGRIHDAFAEHERIMIGKRTSAALRAKRSRGELAAGVPYGFMAIPDENVRRTKRGLEGSRLVPVEDEQRALMMMKERRAAGASLREVGRALEAAGLRPKRGKKWHAEVIRKLLGEKREIDEAKPPLLGW